MRIVSAIADTIISDLKPVFGIYPWFIIKIQLSYQLHLTYAKGQLPDFSKHKLKYTKPIKNKKIALKTFLTLLSQLLKITYLHFITKISKVEVLAIGYLAHNKINNGVSENPYLHPHIKDVGAKNHQVYYLDCKDSSELSLQYVNLLIAFYKSYFKLKLFISKDKLRVLKSYGLQFNKELYTQAELSIDGLEQFLADKVIEYKVHVLAYKFWLRKLQPKTVFAYCYYDNKINALLSAAKKLGITTVECQHSAISNNHFAYGKWKYLDEIEEHFPTDFYVWNTTDKTLVETNFKGRSYAPNVTVKGLKHLTIKTDKTKVARTKILICLQGIWMPDWLETFICNNECYEWFIRLHPRYPNDKLQLEKVAKLQKPNIYIEEANTLNLEALLVQSKALVTCFSGTALEALSLGVKVLIYGEEGKKSYSEYIDNKLFDYIDNERTIVSTLTKLDNIQ